MEKTAQKLKGPRTKLDSLVRKLQESTHLGGLAAEKLFNPEFEEIMNNLRSNTDDPVRALVTGEQVGDSPAPLSGEEMSLKDLLKETQSAINRRQYMRAASLLGKFHQRMQSVVNILSSFKANVDNIHEKFLFEHLDPEHKQYLSEMKQRFAEQQKDNLIKEASIFDFLHNIGTEEGRALSLWEKRYPRKVEKIKNETNNLLKLSQNLLSKTLSALKDMSKFRVSRKVDNYIETSNKIINEFKSYHEKFKTYYSENVKQFADKPGLLMPVVTDVSQKTQELGEQQVAPPTPSTIPTVRTPVPAVTPTQEHISAPPQTQFGAPVPEALQQAPVQTPSIPDLEVPQKEKSSSEPETEKDRSVTLRSPGVKSSHQKFFNSLKSLANESPQLLKLRITKYAHSIKESDPETYIKLLNIVNSIKE